MQTHKIWRPVPMIKSRHHVLIYNLPASGEIFSELQLEFTGIDSLQPYQRLTIFAETHDKTIRYNEDPQYPRYYVSVFRSNPENSSTQISSNFNLDDHVGYRISFDLAACNQLEMAIGGPEFIGVVERYVVIIELHAEINGTCYVLWSR